MCHLLNVFMVISERRRHHAFFLNRLFTVPQEVGIEKVWYSDTDPVMEIVAKYLDKDAPLGVDKELKARFLLPLMEMKAAARVCQCFSGCGQYKRHQG